MRVQNLIEVLNLTIKIDPHAIIFSGIQGLVFIQFTRNLTIDEFAELKQFDWINSGYDCVMNELSG